MDKVERRKGSIMKGVILAGGLGTRLSPLTKVVCKQLLPVYDKPMIYYPLSTLILAGVTEVLIVSSHSEIGSFEKLLGTGSHLGISISYLVQDNPIGLANGVAITEEWVAGESFWFILGDNLFHGPDFGKQLGKIGNEGAHIFAAAVDDPSAYGVVVFAGDVPDRLIEKPSHPVSNWAIPGIYKFDTSVFNFCKNIIPSPRGEYEIIDLLQSYLNANRLKVTKISRGNAWFDLGTFEQLLRGAQFVQMIEERQGLLVGSPEEASVRMGRLDINEILTVPGSPRTPYIESLVKSLNDAQEF
jgi:glucose-1-phosphate thymidylyltransferase